METQVFIYLFRKKFSRKPVFKLNYNKRRKSIFINEQYIHLNKIHTWNINRCILLKLGKNFILKESCIKKLTKCTSS